MSDGAWVVERHVIPVRHVEVEASGRWWPGVQHGWRMYTDGTGWRAAVRFVAPGPNGISSHDADVTVTQLREPAEAPSAD